MSAEPAGGKRERTRARLSAAALDLFEERGFEATTVAQIAAAAGVSEMTFFRHFPSKELAVLDDPYDPAIVAAVAGQPAAPPLLRTARGLRSAFGAMGDLDRGETRRRVRIVAATPALRAAMTGTNEQTERLIARQLVHDGAPELRARVAAAAAMAALTAALLVWAEDEALALDEAIAVALDELDRIDA